MGARCTTHDMVTFKAGVLSLIWDVPFGEALNVFLGSSPFSLRKRAIKCVICGTESIHVTLEICILTVYECYITSCIPKVYYINSLFYILVHRFAVRPKQAYKSSKNE